MTTNAPGAEELSESDRAPASAGSGGAGGFLLRLFLAFIKVGLALLVLAALAIGAWLIFREIDRSFDSVIVRIDRNTRRVEEAEAEIDALQDQNYERQVQVTELETALATRERTIADLEEELSADLSEQSEMLTGLEEELAELAAQADALSEETALISAGLVALQEDLNRNGQQIDQLGGAVDGLSEMLTTLDSRSADLQSQVDDLAAEELAGWRRAVALFRVWEMIGRTRLRLLEGNLGLAAADIELAVTAMDDLAAPDSEQLPEDLVAIRERLLLAGINLPDQPQAAARDLETAWEALDAILAEALASPAAEATPEE